MKRSLIALLAVFSVSLPRAAEANPSQPNIVVFLVDDMGVMDTSVPFLTDEAGEPKRYPLNDYYRTPSIKRLAAEGIRLNNFYAMSVCSPTRISIMTGQNAARHHTTNWIDPKENNHGPFGPRDWNWQGLRQDHVTLARLLQQTGYRTIHVGKGHFGPHGAEGAEPMNLGFDVNIGGFSCGEPESYYGENHYAKKRYALDTKRPWRAVPHLEAYHGTETFLTEALTIEAKSRVTDAVQAKKPFFLYMAHYAVHAPFDSDPRFAANYVASGKPKPAQAYATLIEGIDKSLGDILDHLESLGVAENTLVLLLGDNGSDAPLGHRHEVASAAPLRGKKGAHYEGGMRVPFVAAWANRSDECATQQRLPIPAGAIQSQLASVLDLFPTVLRMVGIELPDNLIVDGSDLATLLSGHPDAARHETFVMHYPHAPHNSEYFTCYRDGDWKVIYHYFPSEVSAGSHYQLFNLADDPSESTDLAAEKPDQLRSMMRSLIDSLEHHGALYPVDKEDGRTAVRPKLP